MQPRYFFLGVFLLAAMPDPVLAQQPKFWIGKTIMLTKKDVKLFDPERKGDKANLGTLDLLSYHVLDDVNGNLKVKTQRNVIGWIKKSDAVLLENAVKYFTQKIRQDPMNDEGYNSRASAYQLQGKLDQAIKDQDEVIRLNPQGSAYYNRASTYQLQKKYDQALADYNEAIRLEPKEALNHYARGNLWNEMKKQDRSVKDYSQAIRLDPKYADAYYGRGKAWHDQKKVDQAIADYTRAIQLDKEEPLYYYGRGCAWYDKLNYDKAIADFDASIRADSQYINSYIARGNAWTVKKNYETAKVDFEEALRINSKEATALGALAWLLATCPDEKMRDGKKARGLAKQAVAIDKTNMDLVNTLAAAEAENGNFAEAVRLQERVVLDPQFKDDAGARERLELYRKKRPYREK